MYHTCCNMMCLNKINVEDFGVKTVNVKIIGESNICRALCNDRHQLMKSSRSILVHLNQLLISKINKS